MTLVNRHRLVNRKICRLVNRQIDRLLNRQIDRLFIFGGLKLTYPNIVGQSTGPVSWENPSVFQELLDLGG